MGYGVKFPPQRFPSIAPIDSVSTLVKPTALLPSEQECFVYCRCDKCRSRRGRVEAIRADRRLERAWRKMRRGARLMAIEQQKAVNSHRGERAAEARREKNFRRLASLAIGKARRLAAVAERSAAHWNRVEAVHNGRLLREAIKQIRGDIIKREEALARIAPEAIAERRRRKIERQMVTGPLWKARNPDKVRAYKRAWNSRRRKRMARKADRGTSKMWLYSMSARVISCYWCGGKTRKGGRNVDHIVPISKGGTNESSNLCIACVDCNAKKSNLMPNEFSRQGILL